MHIVLKGRNLGEIKPLLTSYTQEYENLKLLSTVARITHTLAANFTKALNISKINSQKVLFIQHILQKKVFEIVKIKILHNMSQEDEANVCDQEVRGI